MKLVAQGGFFVGEERDEQEQDLWDARRVGPGGWEPFFGGGGRWVEIVIL